MKQDNKTKVERIIIQLQTILETDRTLDEFDREHIEGATEILGQTVGYRAEDLKVEYPDG